MALIYKKQKKTNPIDKDAAEKYYPSLITLGKSVNEELIAYQIKELSALSKGDIQSVITNLFDVVRTNLYSGHSVNIRNFGIFSLAATTEGSATKEECTAKKIKAVRINFRPSNSIKPDINATRAEDKLSFVDFDTYLRTLGLTNDGNGGNNGNGSGAGNGEGEIVEPIV